MPEYSKKLVFTVIIALVIVFIFFYLMFLFLAQIQIARSTEKTTLSDTQLSEDSQKTAAWFSPE